MAAIIAALYVVIMVESMTGGIALYRIIETAVLEFAEKPAQYRNFGKAMEFGFYNVALSGYILSLPCLCYAVHKRHGRWIYPYLVWRVILTVLIVALAIFICASDDFYERNGPELYLKLLPPVGAAVVLGTIFFGIALGGMKYFSRFRIGRIEQLLR